MEGVQRSLSTIWVIAKQEFNLFVISPIIYFVSAIWLFLVGLFFAITIGQINSGGAVPSMSNPLDTMVFLLVFLAPAFTMRSISEELRSGTHELLVTSPVQEWEIVVGKWVGIMLVFISFIFIPMLLYPAILLWRGNPDIALLATGYGSLLLSAGATLAIGLLASALTQYQIVAYLISVTIMIFMLIAEGVGNNLINNQLVADVFSEITLTGHYRTLLNRPLVDPVDIAYFIGIIVICLFVASQILTSRRLTS